MSKLNELSRSQRLKAATEVIHQALDSRIMAQQPFASRANYARFISAQYCFLHESEPLYDNAQLAALLPDLDDRRRRALIAQDLADLNQPIPLLPTNSEATTSLNFAEALGWLYVVEGSKLGAAILLRLAEKIGLGGELGARHLAAHPDGRARHWRAFTSLLDSATLSSQQEDQLIASAKAGFACMNAHLDSVYSS